METKYEFELVNTISGEHANVIQIALTEINTRNIEIEKYDLLFYESPTSWLIYFRHVATPDSYRGSLSGSPSYEVEINKKDNRVIRSNGIR